MKQTVKDIKVVAPKVRKVVEIESIWRVDDVAKYLGVTRQHVYDLKKDGKIPYRTRGALLFFIPSEIFKWVGDGAGVKFSKVRENFSS